jgi:hypothetical protein
MTEHDISRPTPPPPLQDTTTMSQIRSTQRRDYAEQGVCSDEDEHLFLPSSPSPSLPARLSEDDPFSHPSRAAQDWSYFVDEPEESKLFRHQHHYGLHLYDQSPRRMIEQSSMGNARLYSWKTDLFSNGDDPEHPDSTENPPKKRYIRRPTYAPRPPAEADPQQDGCYMREVFSLSDNMELALAHLVEPTDGGRPNYPLPLLVALAIHGSPNRRLTLQEIFREIENRFTWYANTEDRKSWRVCGSAHYYSLPLIQLTEFHPPSLVSS